MKMKRYAGAWCFWKSGCHSYCIQLPKLGDSDRVLTNKMPSIPSLSSCYISFTLIRRCIIKISDIQDDRGRATVGSLMLPGSCQSTCYWRLASIFLVLSFIVIFCCCWPLKVSSLPVLCAESFSSHAKLLSSQFSFLWHRYWQSLAIWVLCSPGPHPIPPGSHQYPPLYSVPSWEVGRREQRCARKHSRAWDVVLRWRGIALQSAKQSWVVLFI